MERHKAMELQSIYDKPVLLEVPQKDKTVAIYNVAPILKFMEETQADVSFQELGDDLQDDVNNLAMGYNEITDLEKNRIAWHLVNLTKCFKAMKKL